MYNKQLAKITLIPRKLPMAVITFYRYALSPFLGQNCRFYPSCSQYAHLAFKRFGIIYGSWLTLKRLLRCHPFNEGGVDLVPNKKHRQ